MVAFRRGLEQLSGGQPPPPPPWDWTFFWQVFLRGQGLEKEWPDQSEVRERTQPTREKLADRERTPRLSWE